MLRLGEGLMSRQDYFENEILDSLEKLSNYYYLRKGLEYCYKSKEDKMKELLERRIKNYQERIDKYYNHPDIDWRKNKPRKEKLVKPVDSSYNFDEIALKATCYFKQGLEMYFTSLKMNINSSPLVEYYGFLQCVKGRVLLDLDVGGGMIFSKHGVQQNISDSAFIGGNIRETGVLHSLLLLECSFNEMDEYFSGKREISLEPLMNRIHENTPVSPFIVSFLLSCLVRYRPQMWQEICDGRTDDLILEIKKYRREKIPDAIERVLRCYVLYPSMW